MDTYMMNNLKPYSTVQNILEILFLATCHFNMNWIYSYFPQENVTVCKNFFLIRNVYIF